MGCGCNKTTLERFFGRQMEPNGVGREYERANLSSFNMTLLPYVAHPNPDNTGAKIGRPFYGPVPVEYPRNYHGQLPLSQQPRIDVPEPFTYKWIK